MLVQRLLTVNIACGDAQSRRKQNVSEPDIAFDG
jgi:hypothetical protein